MRKKRIVINTGPLLAITAALGNLSILDTLYEKVTVPLEVSQEILAGGPDLFAVAEFKNASWLEKRQVEVNVSPFLRNSLDKGEAAVIQTAIDESIDTVCIDEKCGRRVARLNSLKVTGSIGILLRARKEGHPINIPESIERMQERNIWLSSSVIDFALNFSSDGGK